MWWRSGQGQELFEAAQSLVASVASRDVERLRMPVAAISDSRRLITLSDGTGDEKYRDETKPIINCVSNSELEI